MTNIYDLLTSSPPLSPPVIYDMSGVIDAINSLKDSTNKSGWITYIPFFSVFLATILGYWSNRFFELFKYNKAKTKGEAEIRKAQASEITAIMMSFTNDITALIALKKQRLKPIEQDLVKIEVAKNEGRKVSEFINTLTELFKFIPPQTLNLEPYADKLSFMASHRPVYLITFRQVQANLISINYDIQEANNFIRQHMDRSMYDLNANIDLMDYAALKMLPSYYKALELHIDQALGFMYLAAEHVAEYKEKWLPNENIRRPQILDKFKDVMPNPAEFEEYKKMVAEAVAFDEAEEELKSA